MNLLAAYEIGTKALLDHGLRDLGWSFGWMNGKSTFGHCNYSARAIRLSKYLTPLRSEHEVTMTILHEVAHALTPGHNHDRVWKRKCLEIGGDGRRCGAASDEALGQVAQAAKYVGTCQRGHIYPKHRISRQVANYGLDQAYRCPKDRTSITWQQNY